jgi:CHAT domain-containing protein
MVYFYNGDFSKALEMYDRSIFLNYLIKNHVGLGNSYRCKGDIYLHNGNYLKALDMYEKALSSFEIFGEPRGFGSVYLQKGNIYLKSGGIPRARDMFKKALPFFEKAGDLLDQGNTNFFIGDTYLHTGKDKKALEMYEKAVPFFEKTGELRGQGTVYLRRGDIFLKKKKYSEALEMYEKAIPYFEKAGAIINQANAYRGIGDINFKNAEYSKALDMYEKAHMLDIKIGDLVSEASTLCRKARFFARQGKKKKTLSLYEKAIDNIEKIRGQTASSAMKMSFLKEAYEDYQEATVFLLENKYDKRGFVCVESLKARVFLDRLSEGLVPLEKGLKPGLKEKQDQLVGKLSFLSKEMYTTDLKEEKKLQQLKEQYRKTEDEFEELLIKIRLENPLYAAVRYPQPVSVRELQKNVLKKGEILLSYFISQEKTYVFLISKKRFKVVPLEVKAEKIKSHVNLFLRAIKENNTRDMKMYGQLLYRGLIKPIEAKLKGSRDIIIIPHGHLEKIPFDSFIIGEAKSDRPIFLLEKYRLKYVQSASILSILRKHYHRDRETKNFIAFGDPVYDYEKFKQSKVEPGSTPPPRALADEIKHVLRGRYDRAGGTWKRLFQSGEEIKAIARLFENKSQKCMVYLRDQATEDNAGSADMKDFDFIHFACHGLLNDDFQSLVLSQDIPGSQEDGYFTLNEIMNCDYNAKLVVLSACQTGSGKMERAEGVTGLTRAVMYAGAPAVIASLWHVDDPATKELMVTFYRNMLEKNLNKAEALRQAKLEMIKNKKYRSPLLWSAFIMYGE